MATTTTPPVTTIGEDVIGRVVEPPEPKKFSFGRALAWTFMILVIIASLFPFYWMLRTALSHRAPSAGRTRYAGPVTPAIRAVGGTA